MSTPMRKVGLACDDVKICDEDFLVGPILGRDRAQRSGIGSNGWRVA